MNMHEITFWQEFPKLNTEIDWDSPYIDLLQTLRKTAQDYFQKHQKCRIYGVENVDYEQLVPVEDIESVCQDIWDHADKYSKWPRNSEEAYSQFTEYLWVEYPDGRDIRLVDIAK